MSDTITITYFWLWISRIIMLVFGVFAGISIGVRL